MASNQRLQEQAVGDAEAAFLTLAEQIDHLFNLIAFYLERYPPSTSQDLFISVELYKVASNLGELAVLLSQVVRHWKQGNFYATSRSDVRQNLLEEIWVNAQPLLAFFLKKKISVEPFHLEKFKRSLQVLASCSRHLCPS